MIEMQVGARWGNVTLERWEAHAVTAHGITDTQGRSVWHLRCDCGHEWKVERQAFAGVRRVRSCGRENCKYARRWAAETLLRVIDGELKPTGARRRVTTQDTLTSHSVRSDLVRQLGELARKLGTSRSALVEMAIARILKDPPKVDRDGRQSGS